MSTKIKAQDEIKRQQMNQENDQTLDKLSFVFLDVNRQKVANHIASFKKASVFAFVYSTFFFVEKHIAIYYEYEKPPNPLTKSHEILIYSFNLHTIYAVMTLLTSFLLVFKSWHMVKGPDFQHYGLDKFKKGYTKIENYLYFNLILVLFCLIRYFEAGILHIWLDVISSIIGIAIGKYLEKQRQYIISLSSQLKEDMYP